MIQLKNVICINITQKRSLEDLPNSFISSMVLSLVSKELQWLQQQQNWVTIHSSGVYKRILSVKLMIGKFFSFIVLIPSRWNRLLYAVLFLKRLCAISFGEGCLYFSPPEIYIWTLVYIEQNCFYPSPA